MSNEIDTSTLLSSFTSKQIISEILRVAVSKGVTANEGLKALCALNGITVSDVASMACQSQAYVSCQISGKRRLTTELSNAFTGVFGFDVVQYYFDLEIEFSKNSSQL